MAERTKARELKCVDCGSRIALIGAIKLGQGLICPECDAAMEIVGLDPVEADWIYDEPEYEEEEEEEEEEQEDDDW